MSHAGDLPLHEAVLAGDAGRLEAALATAGVSAEAMDAGGRTALHLAARRSMAHAVRHLVHAGCDPRRQDVLLGWTPLRYLDRARHMEWQYGDLEIAELLLPEDGRSEDLVFLANTKDRAFVFFVDRRRGACERPKMMLWWLRQGDGECRYREALLDVVYHDLPLSTHTLLQKGAATCGVSGGSGSDGDDGGSGGGGGGGVRERAFKRRAAAAFTCLRRRKSIRCLMGGNHLAAEREAFSCALIYDRPLSIISRFPERLWDNAQLTGNSKRGWTPLHVALAAGNLLAAERHLKKGADAVSCTRDGIQPLHCVVENYAQSDDETRLEALRLLLNNGAHLDCRDGEGNIPVCRATSVGGVKILKFFFDNGVSTDTCDDMGRTLLHYATKVSVVDFLVDRGVDPNMADVQGRLAVHSAAKWGHIQAVEGLLRYTRPDARDLNGHTALHLAAREGHAKVVELLAKRTHDHVDSTDSSTASRLEKKVSCAERRSSGSQPREVLQVGQRNTHILCRVAVDEKNVEGRTALHFAVGNAHLSVTEILLTRGASPQALDKQLESPLNYVFLYERGPFTSQIVKLLLEAGANPNHRDKKGKVPLHRATKARLNEVLLLLLEYKAFVDVTDGNGRTALHMAAKEGHAWSTEKLLAYGADPLAQDNQKQTPFNYLFCNQIRYDKIEIFNVARMLLEAGADSNHLNVNGLSPLHQVLINFNLKMVNLLLEHKACLNWQDATGRTALHLAVDMCNPELTEVFLKHGADPMAEDNRQETPLNYLYKSSPRSEGQRNSCDLASSQLQELMCNIAQMLLAAGADPNRLDADGSSLLHHALIHFNVEMVNLLLEHKACLNLKDATGRTALHLAVDMCHLELTNDFLSRGADPSAVDNRHETPLNYLFKCSPRDGGHKDHREGLTKILLTAGADPDHQDADGSTALHCAARENEPEVAKLLLQRKSRVDLRDVKGRTALHLAAESGAVGIVRLLLGRGADSSALDNQQQTPLNYAHHSSNEEGYVGTAKLLLEAGTDANHLDSKANSPLHRAAARGAVGVVEVLLRHGARGCDLTRQHAFRHWDCG